MKLSFSPDHGPGRSGTAPVSPATSPDTEPDTDEPPTEPSPSTPLHEDGEDEEGPAEA